MKINLSFQKNKVSKYIQIAEYIENGIINGELVDGDILPTQRDLALQLGVSRSTVISAYNKLEESGLIETIQGSGTRVCEQKTNQRLIKWNLLKNDSYKETDRLVTRIRTLSSLPDIINFSNGKVAKELFPEDGYRSSLLKVASNPDLNTSREQSMRKLQDAMSVVLEEGWGVSIEPREILLTFGIRQAIALLINGLLNQGDCVAVESPSPLYVSKLFDSFGIKTVKLLRDEEGSIPEHIEELYRKHRIRMVFIYPTNQIPTGITLSSNRRSRIIEICNTLHVPIIEIDTLSPLTYQADYNESLYSLDPDNVIHVGSIGDTVTPELGIAWILASKNLRSRLEDLQFQLRMGGSIVTLEVMYEFIRSGYWTNHVNKLKHNLHIRVQLLTEALEKHAKGLIKYIPPEGGPYVWAKLTFPIKDKELFEQCIKNKVLIVPGIVFGEKDGFLRFSLLSCEKNEVEEGIKRVVDSIHTLRGDLK